MNEQNVPNKTVLVVEDDPEFVKIITDKLNKSGLAVVSCPTADQGLDLLEKNQVDLIWLDHYLVGDKTGYDFVATVKKDARFKKIPLFLVTNYDDYGNTVMFLEKIAKDENPKTYLEFGVDRYFVKSNTSLDTILNEVKKFLKIS